MKVRATLPVSLPSSLLYWGRSFIRLPKYHPNSPSGLCVPGTLNRANVIASSKQMINKNLDLELMWRSVRWLPLRVGSKS